MSIMVKANSPSDFLALVPHLVGFDPVNSVVLVAFRGTGTCGVLRLDLPSAPVVHKRLATHAVGILCKIPDVEAVGVIICTEEKFGASATPPLSEFATTMISRLRQSGLALRGALCRAGDGWGSYFDSAGPVGGHPLSDIERSEIATGLPDTLFDVADPPDAPIMERRRVARQLARYRDLARGGLSHPDFAALDDIALFVEQALEWDEHEFSERAAFLLFLLQSPPSRDATMLQWATNLAMGDELWEHSRDPVGVDPEWDESSGNLMLGIGPRPDAERLLRAISLLLRLVAVARKPARPPLLCMLAWLNWALGRGTIGGRHVAAALGIAPGYGMAQLLNTVLGNGMQPEWAFTRPMGEGIARA
jgi:hypothetical protein